MISICCFATYVEIYGYFTETYRIVIAYTEMEIDVIKQKQLAVSLFLSDQVTNYVNIYQYFYQELICALQLCL